MMCVQYIGRFSVHRGDIMSTSRDVQYIGGYHEYIRGISWVHRGKFSTSGDVQYIGGISWFMWGSKLINTFNFVVMYIRCCCNCALLLTIFGILPSRHMSYKYHDKPVFVPSVLHLSLVNFTSKMSYKAYASWPISFCVKLTSNKIDVVFVDSSISKMYEGTKWWHSSFGSFCLGWIGKVIKVLKKTTTYI